MEPMPEGNECLVVSPVTLTGRNGVNKCYWYREETWHRHIYLKFEYYEILINPLSVAKRSVCEGIVGWGQCSFEDNYMEFQSSDFGRNSW